MKLDNLDNLKKLGLELSEEDIKMFGAWCMERGLELEAHRKQKVLQEIATKEKALADQITAMQKSAAEEKGALLAKHGIAEAAQKKNGKAKRQRRKDEWKPKAGHRYQHPDEAAKEWSGTGPRPGWVKELIAVGRLPKEVAAPVAKVS